MAGQQPGYARRQMTISKPKPMDRTALPRTGHGAASLIPHLNVVVPLEPAHLDDPMDDAPARDEAARRTGDAKPNDDLSARG